MKWFNLIPDIQSLILEYIYLDLDRQRTCHLRETCLLFDMSIKHIIPIWIYNVDKTIQCIMNETILINTLIWIYNQHGLHNSNVIHTHRSMDRAAEKGYLKVLCWLKCNKAITCTKYAMDEAASNGYLDVVHWLTENTLAGCTNWAMDGAAAHGHLHVIKWLADNNSEGCSKYALSLAVENKHFDVVEWLLDHKPSLNCVQRFLM
jgi:hypothetical protein